MSQNFKNPFEYKLIYVFTIEDKEHEGFVKVGDTTISTDLPVDRLTPNSKFLNKAARKRIDQYTKTAGISYHLLHTELALRNARDRKNKPILRKNGIQELESFRDHDIHRVLRNSGYKSKRINNTTGQEWFKTSLDTVIKAINAYKTGKTYISDTTCENLDNPFTFRPEQKEAIESAVNYLKKKNSKHFLWNAKMRFGKTLSALEVVKELKMKKTIIVTHRPVVEEGWFEDFSMIFKEQDKTLYGSKNKAQLSDLLFREKNYDESFIYFASIQDLRGSKIAGGNFDKNQQIFSTDWDMVIIDEAHEGTQTQLGEHTLNELIKEHTKVLYLSGTPFNIQNQFKNEETFVWDYTSEQKAKKNWNSFMAGDSNPYEDLPSLKMFTYNLSEDLKNNFGTKFDDIAFNFKEFFKTEDRNGQITFKHENAVRSFLDLMIKEEENSNYPYSKEEYRNYFKHSLWMVPGVKEARALSNLLKEYPIFALGFEIINVAGEGDEERSNDSLLEVKKAIKKAEVNGKGTITISCGRLTTGVTVPEWTAVFMLSGSNIVSVSNYLQTIFRVQSPAILNGKTKTFGYVFDFAPDRALNMIAQAVSVSTEAGKTKVSDRQLLGEFLNFCPVIAIKGSEMRSYNVNQMLQSLKKAYAEKVVLRGFDDVKLYNEELLHLTDDELYELEKIQNSMGASGNLPKLKTLEINNTGLTGEEFETITNINNKKPKKRTPEEIERLKEINKKKNNRRKALNTLRAISVRMPLLIYGSDIPYDENITLEKFIDLIDDDSWEEFMPKGVTKKVFRKLKRFYDEDIFIEAGRSIREKAKNADFLPIKERIREITELFSYFKNPDKETVLTPWRVVNMQMSNTIGGWSFFDEEYSKLITNPHFNSIPSVTESIFNDPQSKILDINSKTGFYSLYMAFSFFQNQIKGKILSKKEEEKIWEKILEDNIFILCKTEMAKSITIRTLAGYKDFKVNAHHFKNILNTIANKQNRLINRISYSSFWNRKGGKMKFKAVVGNPPYQSTVNESGKGLGAIPLYHHYVNTSRLLKPDFISLIIPSRWFSGGVGLKDFRESMLNDKHIKRLVDFTNSNDCFPGVDINGGVCYFLWDKNYENEICSFSNINSGNEITQDRVLNEFNIFIRRNEAISIVKKVLSMNEKKLSSLGGCSPQTPYGFLSTFKGSDTKSLIDDCKLLSSKGWSFVPRSEVKKYSETIDLFKPMISKLSCEHAGNPDKNGQYRVLSRMELLKPGEICNQSYLVVAPNADKDIAENIYTYLKTKFVRFLILQTLSGMNISINNFQFVPWLDFSKKWTDEKLYQKYKLTNDEIEFIESTIKPMD